MTLKRFSSRLERLDKAFLAKSLDGATKYLRIAGYFRSSIFELVGEQISKIPEVKILCNSELDHADFAVATGRETALKERWNENDVEAQALLQKDRYQKLDALLKSGNVEIRVVPKERLFLHGKAGSIHYPDGRRVSFIGSVNESKSAFSSNYELVWQDDEPESADWVESEFWALWEDGIPLPKTIIDEISRVANRREISISALKPLDIPAAAMAEAPIYRGGEQLQPWQRSFVTLFLKHRELYGKARLLLADEVGVGKTLSMATSALVSALLDDGPILILTPSTLTIQWQVELNDKLGIPSAVWSSGQKVWLGVEGHPLSPKGHPESIKSCPYQIAIVSTGLVMHQRDGDFFIKEAGYLVNPRKKYGTIIVDEAHKARVKGGLGKDSATPNNLLTFIEMIGKKTKHMILGTATPIQTKVRELWDLLTALNSGCGFILGDTDSPWRNWEVSVPLVTGKADVHELSKAWEYLRHALPPEGEHGITDQIRADLNIPSKDFFSCLNFQDLDDYYMIREMHLPECLGSKFFRDNNPVIRHVVLRKRTQLEDMGLLERVAVEVHPLAPKNHLYNARFVDLGLLTNPPFEAAYQAAEDFCSLLRQRTKSAGFMKSLMLQRICSSFESGRKTAEQMLKHAMGVDPDSEEDTDQADHILAEMTPAEIECLEQIITQLSRPTAKDPKLDTITFFLKEFRTDGKTWLEHGCIVFSQYYDTASWVARRLAEVFPDQVIAVYAGAGKSGLFKGNQFAHVERESIKKAVKNREIKLLIATDAACEGLNLQTLGTLINIDLPWNPSRLEQRLGRIKRFGQSRRSVDMLNLVYHETQDQKIYRTLSSRLKDTFDIFGSLPDTIEDEWIESEELLKERIDQYIHEREDAENAFTVKYRDTVSPDANKWEKCSEVLSRRDIDEIMRKGW
nr:DEAD/DEAH box helicase family protein [Desulfobulbaceae bacterium]